MQIQPDVGYCVHGRPIGGDCFFCRSRGRTVAETMDPPPATIPEHRNPQAAEALPSRAFSISARKGAAAKHRKAAPQSAEPSKASPAPPSRRAGIAGRTGGLSTAARRNRMLRLFENGQSTGAIRERAACADLVRAAGCICDLLEGARAEREGIDGFKPPFGRVVVHDPRCPHALAAEIEART